MSGSRVTGKPVRSKSGPFISAALEMLLLLIPLLLFGAVSIQGYMWRSIYDYEIRQYDLLMKEYADVVEQRICGLSPDGEDAQENPDLKPFFGGNLVFEASGWTPIKACYLVAGKDGTLEMLEDGFRSSSSPETAAAFARIAEKAQDEKTDIIDDVFIDGTKYHVFARELPARTSVWWGEEEIFSVQREEALVLCLAVENEEVRRESLSAAGQPAVVVLVGIAAVVLLLSFLIIRSLRVLKPMQITMEELAEGKDPAEDWRNWKKLKTGENGGNDEITDLKDTFCRVAENIREYAETVEGIRSVYQPFLPDGLLKLFGKSDMREIAPGDRAELFGDLLLLRLEGSGEEKETADAAAQRNPLIGEAVDLVLRHGGLVLEIGFRDVLSFFRLPVSGAPEQSAAAKTASEAAGLTRSEAFAGSGIREIRTALVRRKCSLRVIGAQSGRMAIMTDSESLAALEQEICAQAEKQRDRKADKRDNKEL